MPDLDTDQRMKVRTDRIAEMRGEAGRGDAQTAIAFGVASGGLLLAVTSNTAAALPAVGQVIWWGGIAAGMASAVTLGAVIYPQPANSRGVPGAVFNAWHVLAASTAGTLAAAFDATPTAITAAEEEAARVARVVARKFSLVRRGLQLLAAAGGLIVLAVLTGQIT
ncbi:Pycsar system effector family protein [Glutamicibacter sp. V16R2B1]|uniref:Pycsar system effector family protein n=1 Tax=Glutamicibacter sp. V16R2B1 TaxID=2036207 RepID=UPI0010FD123D|nr:Pycsar system effector family protein [Glutamicibacter sp. V16R2B1]MCK9901327.1 DUF5706 domain-containing protein [Frankia sp. Cpl3]TLK47821.1 hypothetical protein FDN03_15675 [Glutamicibacter sp. V16R2B1]